MAKTYTPRDGDFDFISDRSFNADKNFSGVKLSAKEAG